MVTKSKEEIRQELKETRQSLSEDQRAAAALKLGQNIAAYLDARKIPQGATVAVYQAMSDELSLAPLIALLYAEGARVAFPCTRSQERMDFFVLTAAELNKGMPDFLAHPGRFFPDGIYDYEQLNPQDIDVMVVPAVAYDKRRMRLGMGAGCYDRYLPQLRTDCLTIGVCFDEQLVEELPVGEFDQPVQVVITPSLAF